MKVVLGEHTGLIGTTGSGKTYYAKHAVLPYYRRVVVLDTKQQDFNEPRYKLMRRGEGAHVATRIPRDDKPFLLRIVPPAGEKREWIDEFCLQLLAYKDLRMVLYFDEVTDFADAQRIPEFMQELARTSRAMQVSLIWGTQRPAGVNHWLAENTIHTYFFFVKPYDRDTVDTLYPGIGAQLEQIKWHSYRSIYVSPDGELHPQEAVGKT